MSTRADRFGVEYGRLSLAAPLFELRRSFPVEFCRLVNTGKRDGRVGRAFSHSAKILGRGRWWHCHRLL
jgi:hypothetical protein